MVLRRLWNEANNLREKSMNPTNPSNILDPGNDILAILEDVMEDSSVPWTNKAWRLITPIVKAIYNHPFIKSLVEGTLPKDTFLFYIGQDALYLDDFGKMLGAAALKHDQKDDVLTLFGFALDSIRVEGALHERYLRDFTRPQRQSPSSLLYTSFLYRQLVTAPFPVMMASLLPCFWIYFDVGNHILSLESAPSNPYQDWIDTYGSKEFAASTDKAIKLTERAARNASKDVQIRMAEAFVLASRMEWMFWDSAWRKEVWPI
jgi:thiaminase/transcriptional activator TenA